MQDHNEKSGFFVTIREIHDIVVKIDDKLTDEIVKIKTQLAAQWVIHGIIAAAIIFLVQRGINNG